jgi:hypothetical protein
MLFVWVEVPYAQPEPATGAVPAALERCRELRHQDPKAALEACEQAAVSLAAQASFDAAFEAQMHAAQLATQRGEGARAESALNEAAMLLASVSDPLASHRIARRRGQLAYALGKPAEALGRFLEALAIARSLEQAQAIAISENDVGVVHWHLGDYAAALGHLQASLAAKQAMGDSDVASTLTNIGSLYRELGDYDRAASMLERALELQRSAGNELAVAHTVEELALLAQSRGDLDAARAGMDEAWSLYLSRGAVRDRLRLALRRAQLEAESRPSAADQWISLARAAGRELQRGPLLAAELIAARMATDRLQQSAALDALLAALSAQGDSEPTISAEAYAELAGLAAKLGQPVEALGYLREYQRRASVLAESRHSQRLDALRVRLDLTRAESERDRLRQQTDLQSSEIARRRAQTLVVAAGALLVLAGLVLFFQRRLFRQKLLAAAEKQRLERSIREARSAADALRADVRSMEWLLDRQRSPVLIFDAAGHVRAVTLAAAELLDTAPEALRGMALAELVGAESAARAQQLIEHASLEDDPSLLDAPSHIDPSLAASGLRLHCQRLELEEELGVLILESPGFDPAALKAAAAAAGGLGRLAQFEFSGQADEPQQRFRALLVALMQLSLDLWERLTRKTRIDLAERSGVWRVTIDEGRLRVRAMDRYLSLDTLPDKPRWREVLRTAYFVLAELQLNGEQRQQLEGLAEAVLAHTRKRG